MKAMVRTRYCAPEDVELQEIEAPGLVDDGVLVRVHASSVNKGDWYFLTGTPLFARAQLGLFRPKSPLMGSDFAGTVEAVGKDVTGFAPGDRVFGGRTGAFAEYVCVRNGVARMPDGLTFEEAAAVPVAALTALQGLRDKGGLEPGQSVLVNGASGGVGTFAVQLAKALGAAHVTAVCSTRNVELVRSLGADDVVDYTADDFTRTERRYDLMIDIAGSRPWSQCRRVLKPRATLVAVGAPTGNRVLGPLGHIVKLRVASLRSSQKVVFFVAKFNRADMDVLRELLESGKVKPVVERRYELRDTADALRAMGRGHVQGKLVIAV